MIHPLFPASVAERSAKNTKFNYSQYSIYLHNLVFESVMNLVCMSIELPRYLRSDENFTTKIKQLKANCKKKIFRAEVFFF